MKNLINFVAMICAGGCFFLAASCSKDLGNYSYHAINEVGISGLYTQSDSPQIVFLTDTLNIIPKLTATVAGDATNYTYRWELIATSGEDNGKVLSTERDLHYPVTDILPGLRSISYYVTDKSTGVSWQAMTWIKVNTPVYEGYLVLNEVNGGARLDMLSYNDGTFTQYTDVLKKMGSTLVLDGVPVKVLCLPVTDQGSGSNYGIYLLTDKMTTQIDPENFGWNSQDDISYRFIGTLPEGFKVEDIWASTSYGVPYLWVYSDGKMYSTMRNTPFEYNLAANSYQGTNFQPFPISTKVASVQGTTVLYKTETKTFVTNMAGQDYSSDIDPDYYTYPSGMDLVDLFANQYDMYSTTGYAVLKDPSTSTYKLMRFSVGGDVDYYADIIATDIDKAEHFAASPELGYLFYSVGARVYEYDLSLKTSKLMLDKGNESITVLTFQTFFSNPFPGDNSNYLTWGKWLTVASYDPAGTEGSNGTVALYSVPPVNGQIVEQQKWTGFGKIVSMAYRER